PSIKLDYSLSQLLLTGDRSFLGRYKTLVQRIKPVCKCLQLLNHCVAALQLFGAVLCFITSVGNHIVHKRKSLLHSVQLPDRLLLKSAISCRVWRSWVGDDFYLPGKRLFVLDQLNRVDALGNRWSGE